MGAQSQWYSLNKQIAGYHTQVRKAIYLRRTRGGGVTVYFPHRAKADSLTMHLLFQENFPETLPHTNHSRH